MAKHREDPVGKCVKVTTGVYRKPNGKFLATYVDPGDKRHWKEFTTKNGAVRWRALALVDPSAVIESKRPLMELFEESSPGAAGSRDLRPSRTGRRSGTSTCTPTSGTGPSARCTCATWRTSSTIA